jgi:hypothetical protein
MLCFVHARVSPLQHNDTNNKRFGMRNAILATRHCTRRQLYHGPRWKSPLKGFQNAVSSFIP